MTIQLEYEAVQAIRDKAYDLDETTDSPAISELARDIIRLTDAMVPLAGYATFVARAGIGLNFVEPERLVDAAERSITGFNSRMAES